MASEPVLSRDVGNRTSLVDQPVIVISGIVKEFQAGREYWVTERGFFGADRICNFSASTMPVRYQGTGYLFLHGDKPFTEVTFSSLVKGSEERLNYAERRGIVGFGGVGGEKGGRFPRLMEQEPRSIS